MSVVGVTRRSRPAAPTIPPGTWLGLLGGGQLGRMFCMAAQSLGYKVAVLDPGADSPAGSVADRHIAADYLDLGGLSSLRKLCRGATTEFENVPAAALEFLARELRVTPGAASVAIAQDRISEKTFVSGHGFPVAPFTILRKRADVARIDPALLPGIVKSARLGYDGKGQIRVRTREDVAGAFARMDGNPCVLERMVDLRGEISVIVARDDDGNLATWPVSENRHRNGILDLSIVPARIDPGVAAKARTIAAALATALDYRGVLCVELFVTPGDALVVNEIAPRPHNSGHYTIDACVTSQFEQQARILAALPMGDTLQHTPAVMLNLLGDAWFGDASAAPSEPDWARVLAHPQAKLHLYGKREARRDRKMGHVTCLGATLDDALATAGAIRGELGIPDGDSS
ncbi:MAG TPA: 5-(carboxyamino)imidazole ribonucleotide synthase [Casimicrobiaceae bacterium]|nr:5-(carboxyamino)imidazole ribonucleotide synthase [Casimicrobiaceae bacterium]